MSLLMANRAIIKQVPPIFNMVVEGHSFINISSFNDFVFSQVHPYSGYNAAVSGSFISDAVTRASTVDSKLVANLKNILVLWIGVNDVNNTSGQGTTAYNAMKSYIQNRVSAGWKVFVFTMTPSTAGGRGAIFETERNIFNDLIRDDLSLLEYVYALDTDTVSELTDCSNTTYFSDTLHPTQLGSLISGDLFITKIKQLYGNDLILDDSIGSTLTLTSTGTGNGVSTITLTASQDITLTVDGNSNFYTDSGGTLNESKTWSISKGISSTRYIKCTSGTSNLEIPKNAIVKFEVWTSATNAPSLGGSIANMTSLTYISIGGLNTLSGSIASFNSLRYIILLGSNTLSGNISNLLLLNTLNVQGSNTLTGSVSNLLSLTYLTCTGSNTLSGSLQNLFLLYYVNAQGSNTLTGSVAGLTLLTYLQVSGSNTLSGDIAGLVLAQLIYVQGSSSLTFSNVTNITHLCYLNVHTTTTLTSENVNQLLADFWTNKDASKPLAFRVINIAGSVTSGAPTGQGITDKANLAAYRSPNPPGTAALWTVTTR